MSVDPKARRALLKVIRSVLELRGAIIALSQKAPPERHAEIVESLKLSAVAIEEAIKAFEEPE